MVRVTEGLALSPEHVTLYYASDPLLGHLPVLIFHGPSTTANYTANSSRIQVHVYSPAGLQSFPRITISPNSPFYGVVSHLPREFQGDEVYRGLAFGLFKYFTELPELVKNHLKHLYPTTRGRRPGSAPALFGEQHAADLAKAMVKADNAADTIQALQHALQAQHISNVDIDLVLPPGSITPLGPDELEEVPEDEDDILDPTLRQYGMYTPLVRLWGEPVFLPTSRLRRAPSRPTSLNRSKSFTKDQKLDLRMKLGELIDTEERYVLKLNELVKHIADDFRQTAKSRAPGSASPSEEEIGRLFPRSADRILQLNSAFAQELRKAMDDSEESASKDVEPQASHAGPRPGSSARARDPSGALAVARLFLEWFPKFTDSYQEYIRASQHFPQLLNSFLDRQSSFRQRVAQTGEQALRSILIEPVQRLPRYSLLIDQIVGCLPITHPALQLMLRARDIIANICSMDDPLEDKPHVTNRLRNMIECWPLDLEPQGRLILAADFVELAAPYVAAPPGLNAPDRAGIFLLFSDCIVILRKKSANGPTGRELLREIDKPSPAGLLASMTNAAGGAALFDVAFSGWHNLADVRFTESSDGRLVWMTSTQEMKGAHAGEYVTSRGVTSRCFLLQDAFEGKAARWSEDIVKARIEGRFPEAERESSTWTLRSVKMPDSNLGMHAAVFQEGAEQLVEGRKEPAPIRVVIDNDKGTKSAPVGHYGVEIVVEMRADDLRRVRMNSLGLNGKLYTDDVALEDLLPTLSRRITQLLSSQFNIANLRLAPALVSYYTKAIRSLSFSAKIERPKSFLATSPVKLLSSFLSGVTVADTASSAPRPQSTPVSGLFPPPPSLSRSSTHEKASSFTDSIKSRDRIAIDDDRPENPLMRLEQTFTGYVASLQARKGYFVGRTLLNRSVADELSVNDLYNRLIESPFDLDASSELGPEVIFVTFEKFVRIAWRDQIGPIITMQALDLLQERASRRVVGDFGDFVNYIFGDMAPQNRRAFTALIKLLADLLDGCSNDGDRGALTLAFAELLVDDGSAHNYINLLDRLVEDCDRIFDDGFGSSLQSRASAYDSMNSTIRSHRSIAGSVTSNASSLRRKLGFDTLLRQNSKDERDRPSVWRTLSKHGRNPATGESSSLSSASVNRSRSIDMGYPTMPAHKMQRPGSRDRPPIAGAFDDMVARPASSHRLETIGEPDAEGSESRWLKNKRRSSLSDLKSLMAAATLEEKPLVPLEIAKPTAEKLPLDTAKQTSEKFNSSPRAPATSRIPISPKSQALRSPPGLTSGLQSPGLPADLRSPRQKENMAEVFRKPSPPPTAVRPSPVKRAHSKTISASSIPTLKLTSRPRSGSELSPTRPSTSPTKSSSSATQRLRMQSPQKLRERLQTEKNAIDEVDSSLKTELSRIAEDMARVNGGGSAGGLLPPRTAAVDTQDLRQLTAAVRALEERVPREMQELSRRMEAVQHDTEAALKASEDKVKAIDQMYREATAENELLYEKFNSELGRIVKALRGKGREDKEDLVGKLKEQSEETARAKRENARLKRDMASLRTLLKGGEGGRDRDGGL